MTPTRITILAAAAITLCAGSALAQAAANLFGRYQMEMDATQYLDLRADGTGSLDGEALKWSAKGGQLTLVDASGEAETHQFKLLGERLVLSASGIELAFKRVGAPGKAPGALARAKSKAQAKEEEVSEEDADREAMEQARAWLAANGGGNASGGAPGYADPQQPQQNAPGRGRSQPAQRGSPVDQQIQQLLLSSAWCSFTFSGSGGYTRESRSRVVFQADGTGFRSTGGESSSTGYGGTYAGASQGGQPFRWSVQGGRLIIDVGAGPQDANLQVSRNSNGYPILNAAGAEYMGCQ